MMFHNINLVLDSAGVNPLDITSYIMQKTDIIEEPVYINGGNVGTSKTGKPINDRIHTRYSFSVPLKPLPQSIYQRIIAKCEENEFEVTYTSARSNADVSVDAQCSLSEFKYATTVNGERIYHGCVITVEGK